MKKLLLKYYPLIIILLLATVLRINIMFNRGTVWFDEYYSVHFSSIPSLAETWKYWVMETNPPFYHLFLRFYLPFVDKNNEILLRLPSIIFGIITIALLYIYAQKLFSRRVAILSSLFLTLTTVHIRYSTEIRMYSLFAMIVMISFILYHKIIFEKKNTKLLWFFYALLTTILLYTHLSGPAIILIQFATLLYIKTDKNLIKKWLLSQSFAISLWLIWFIPSLITQLTSDIESAWYLNNGTFTNHTIINSLITPFLEFSPKNHFFTTITTLLIPFVIYLLYKKTKTSTSQNKNYIFLISAWTLIPIVFSALAGIFVPKYLISAYLGLFLLVAYIIDAYTVDSKKKFAITLFFVIILMLPPAITASNRIIFTWKPFAEYIEKNETPNSMSLLFFSEAETFKEYYHGNQPVVSIYTRQDDLPLYERIVKYNWNKHNISDEAAKKWLIEKIKENKADKIYLMLTGGMHNEFHFMLFEDGWSLKNKFLSPGDPYMSYLLLEFDAPINK